MEKEEIYRITKGKLVRDKEEILLNFGLIYMNDGYIYTEFYVDEKFDLNHYCGISLNEEVSFFTAFCTTDNGDDLEIRGLDFKELTPYKHLMEMISYDCLIHTRDQSGIIANSPEAVTPQLHYLVLEGLEMEYCEATKQERTSRNKKIGASSMNWDHVQRLSTKDKMYGILSDMKIELTDDLIALIDIVRNDAVHKGIIGEGEEAYKNVLLLNELIHEIILRLIKYLGPRKSTFLFGRTVMCNS